MKISFHGADQVSIYGEDIRVKASIHTIGGFSAHADQTELLEWHQQTGNPKTTFLVHREEEAMYTFAKTLKNTKVEMPSLNQEFIL